VSVRVSMYVSMYVLLPFAPSCCSTQMPPPNQPRPPRRQPPPPHARRETAAPKPDQRRTSVSAPPATTTIESLRDCRIVRLKLAAKKMSPSGTTLCHSSIAGSGRWSIVSLGTCGGFGGASRVAVLSEGMGWAVGGWGQGGGALLVVVGLCLRELCMRAEFGCNRYFEGHGSAAAMPPPSTCLGVSAQLAPPLAAASHFDVGAVDVRQRAEQHEGKPQNAVHWRAGAIAVAGAVVGAAAAAVLVERGPIAAAVVAARGCRATCRRCRCSKSRRAPGVCTAAQRSKQPCSTCGLRRVV